MNRKPPEPEPEDDSECNAGDTMRVKGDAGATFFIKKQVTGGRSDTEYAYALVNAGTIMTAEGELEGVNTLKSGTTLVIKRFVSVTNSDQKMVAFDVSTLKDSTGTPPLGSISGEGYLQLDQLECVASAAVVPPVTDPQGVKYAAFKFTSPQNMDIYIKLENNALTAAIDLPTSPADEGLIVLSCPASVEAMAGKCYGRGGLAGAALYQVATASDGSISKLSLFWENQTYTSAHKYTGKSDTEIEQKINSKIASSTSL